MNLVELGPIPVTALAFSGDGAMVYAGQEDGRLARVGPGGDIDELGSFARPVHTIAARPDCDEVYACCSGWIATINPESPPGKPTVLELRHNSVTSIAFVTPDILVTGTGNYSKITPGAAHFDDLRENKVVGKAVNESAGVRAFAVHRPTKTAAWATGDRSVRVSPIAKPDKMKISFDQNVNALTFAPDGKRIALAIGWGIRWVDWVQQKPLREWKGHKGRVNDLHALPDGSILSGSWDELVTHWSPGGDIIRSFQFGIGKITSLAVTDDGSRAAAGGASGNIMIWDLA